MSERQAGSAQEAGAGRALVWGALAVVLLAIGQARLIGPGLGLSEPAERTLCVLLVAAVLWVSEIVPLFVTSLGLLLLELVWVLPSMGRAGVQASSTTFLAPFFSDVVLLFLGGFVLSAALTRYELDERLARGILVRTGGTPGRLLLGVMGVTGFLSMWMSNTASTAMMLSLVVPLLRRVPEGDSYRKALLLAVPFSANLGGLATPIGTPPNAISIRYLAKVGAAPTFGGWMLQVAPVVVVLLFAAWWILRRLYPAGITRLDLPLKPSRPLSRPAKLVLAACAVSVVGWLSSDVHGIAPGVVALVPMLLLFGSGLLGVSDVRSLPWDVLLIVGGGLSLGVAVEQSGLSRWIVGRMPADQAGMWVVLSACCLMAAGMSAVMSNTATANLLLPIVAGLEGVPAAPLVLAVAYACSVSMPLPVSTPPNAMVFGSGQVTVKDMVIPGAIISVLGVALTCTLGAWWWRVLGVY